MGSFDKLPYVTIDAEVERLTVQAQRDLASVDHHRLAPVNVMVAACAHKAETGVRHYDSDYDIPCEKTNLVFESEWACAARQFVKGAPPALTEVLHFCSMRPTVGQLKRRTDRGINLNRRGRRP